MKTCPECRTPVAEEYCGGFWGLVGTDRKPDDHVAEKETPSKNENKAPFTTEAEAVKKAEEETERARKSADKWEEKYNNSKKVFRFIIIALLIFSLMQTINVSIKKHRLKNIQKNSVTMEEYKALEDENIGLKKELANYQDPQTGQDQGYNDAAEDDLSAADPQYQDESTWDGSGSDPDRNNDWDDEGF